MFEGRLQPSAATQLPARQMSAGLDALPPASLFEGLFGETPRVGSGRATPVPPPGALERASSLTAAQPQLAS